MSTLYPLIVFVLSFPMMMAMAMICSASRWWLSLDVVADRDRGQSQSAVLEEMRCHQNGDRNGEEI
jgi:hypothetical protein